MGDKLIAPLAALMILDPSLAATRYKIIFKSMTYGRRDPASDRQVASSLARGAGAGKPIALECCASDAGGESRTVLPAHKIICWNG
jgi:hypothetical protein